MAIKISAAALTSTQSCHSTRVTTSCLSSVVLICAFFCRQQENALLQALSLVLVDHRRRS